METSHPTRVRGLKHDLRAIEDLRHDVAPHAGAWIETTGWRRRPGRSPVAPHAGAWIETSVCSTVRPRLPSHPTRVRGLKRLAAVTALVSARWVAPHAGAWIETSINLWVQTRRLVAPHAGAWIETKKSTSFLIRSNKSHPTRVRGLKLAKVLFKASWMKSHPTRVRGLKPPRHWTGRGSRCRTPRGCVD